MQMIINISEYQYDSIKKNSFKNGVSPSILDAIRNGTPLPKGHGRLIDADKLKEEMEKDIRRAMSFVDLTDFVLLAPTIIEADRSVEE